MFGCSSISTASLRSAIPPLPSQHQHHQYCINHHPTADHYHGVGAVGVMEVDDAVVVMMGGAAVGWYHHPHPLSPPLLIIHYINVLSITTTSSPL
mmetsp:Transcript_9439/g.14191  ORF Transcript_9439/g.14191 Transcript_9439/m.14191 type:complete len:95 (-) Transcript_9439:120-404(-)